MLRIRFKRFSAARRIEMGGNVTPAKGIKRRRTISDSAEWSDKELIIDLYNQGLGAGNIVKKAKQRGLDFNADTVQKVINKLIENRELLPRERKNLSGQVSEKLFNSLKAEIEKRIRNREKLSKILGWIRREKKENVSDVLFRKWVDANFREVIDSLSVKGLLNPFLKEIGQWKRDGLKNKEIQMKLKEKGIEIKLSDLSNYIQQLT